MNAWVKETSGMNELKSFGGDDCLTENGEWRNVPKNDGKYQMYAEEKNGGKKSSHGKCMRAQNIKGNG